jgi:hypothetical protein
MPVETYVGHLEPENQDAVIWRFVNMKKFRDFMETQELYFCRADVFSQDEWLMQRFPMSAPFRVTTSNRHR